MPRIFDNIDLKLLPDLQQTIQDAHRADFCVGYFNLRGWKHLDQYIEPWSGDDGHCVRLLVGMQKLPQEELRQFYTFSDSNLGLDNQTVYRLKRKLAEEFRSQLAMGGEIDRVLVQHYKLTKDKLDFIINYDIKYRMGASLKLRRVK